MAPDNMRSDFPVEAGAGRDQAFGALRQQGLVHARAVVKPLQMGDGGQFQQIFISLQIFDPDDQMARRVADGGRCFVQAAPGRDIQFTADDRFDVVGERLFVEINRAEHRAVVGDGDRRHGEFFGFFKEFVQTDHSVEKAVLCMNMEMDEIGLLHV